MRKSARVWWLAAATAAVPLLAATAASASTQYLPPTGNSTESAVTLLVNRDDGGNASPDPYWAKDTLRRNSTLDELGQAADVNCGASNTAACYGYTLTINDQGGFATIPGAETPNQSGPYAGKTIHRLVLGTMHGYDQFAEFYSTSQPTGGANAGVPRAVTGDGDSTSLWPYLFFPASASLYQGGAVVFPATGAFSQPEWAWSYSTLVAVRTHRNGWWRHPRLERQWWVDASYNNYGDDPGDGNISG